MITKIEKIYDLNNKFNSYRMTKNNIISLVPLDPANKDYQEYLKWLEEGNTPLPAEENN